MDSKVYICIEKPDKTIIVLPHANDIKVAEITSK